MFFSQANRSAAIRIPKYTQEPMEKRIEFRPPDATCNPYLAMSAMLLAGIDGIKKKLNPKEIGFGPFEENLFGPENGNLRKSVRSLPASLEEALNALEEDHEFLTEGEVFRKDTIESWIEYKRNREHLEVRNRPHPYELTLYYNC
jgi:glutamine synthetase